MTLKWFLVSKITPVAQGAYYWVLTPRGRTFVERAMSPEHFVSGYTECFIAGPIEEPRS